VDSGPLRVRAAQRVRGSPCTHLPLDVALPAQRLRALSALLTRFVPTLHAMLRDVSRLPNFHARALTDEEVAERARGGPLLYAAPWGGGLRIVAPPATGTFGPQRRAELNVDWEARPPTLTLSEDGGPARAVDSLTLALGALGAFAAPQRVQTTLRVINAMRPGGTTRRLDAPSAAACAADDAAAEAKLAAALSNAVRLRRERAARREARESATLQKQTVAAPAAVTVQAPAPPPSNAALRPTQLPSPRGTEQGALPMPPLTVERRAALLSMKASDACTTALAAWDKARTALHRCALPGAAAEAALDARVALRTLGVLIRGARASHVREALRHAGLFSLLITLLADADAAAEAGVLGGPAPPEPAALPAPPQRMLAAAPLQRVPSLPLQRVRPRNAPEPVSPFPLPPPSPGDGAPRGRVSAFRDLNEDVEAEEATEAAARPQPATPPQRAGPAVTRVPRLPLGTTGNALALPSTPGDSSAEEAISVASLPHSLFTALLALLLALLVSPDGDTLEVDAAASGPSSPHDTTASGGKALPLSPFSRGGTLGAPLSADAADAAPARALVALCAFMCGAGGAAALPALAPLAQQCGPGAMRLLRLVSPALFTSSLYAQRGRLGRGAFASVHAAAVAPPLGAAVPRHVALKVTDLPPPPPLRRLARPRDAAGAAADASVARSDASALRDVFAEVAALQRLAVAAPGCAPELLDYGCGSGPCATLVLRRAPCSLRAWRQAHGPFPLPPQRGTCRLYAAVYEMALECCAAVAAAGVLHLDIKADNFLLTPTDARFYDAPAAPAPMWAPADVPPAAPLPFRLQLADWGCASLRGAAGTARHAGSECIKAPEMLRAGARAAGAGSGRITSSPMPSPARAAVALSPAAQAALRTAAGEDPSTPPVASPGGPARVGPAADVWASACLAHELFCGAPLFAEAEREWVRFFVHLTAADGDTLQPDAAQRLTDVHPGLRRFCAAALKRQPTARPSADDLLARFRTLHAKLREELPPYAPPRAAPPPEAAVGWAGDGAGGTDLVVADPPGNDAALRCALHAAPTQLGRGLLIAPLAALRGALASAGVTHALRVTLSDAPPRPPQLPPGRSRRGALIAAARRGDAWAEAGAATLEDGARVATWALPRSASAAGEDALDAGVVLIAAALARQSTPQEPAAGCVLLVPALGAEAAAGALAAAWLALAPPAPTHGALGALRGVQLLAPGAAPGPTEVAHLAAWAQRTVLDQPSQ
jgi:hypothetical protein